MPSPPFFLRVFTILLFDATEHTGTHTSKDFLSQLTAKPVAAILLVTGVLILGTTPLVLKVLLLNIDPISLTWYRYTGAAVFLFVASGRPLLDDLKQNTNRRSAIRLLLTGIGLAGNQVLFVAGLIYLTPSTAHIVLQIAPFLVVAGGVVIFDEPFHSRLLIGIALLALGSSLFFNQRYGEIRPGSNLAVGVGILAVSAIAWATHFLAQKTLHETMRSRTILFCSCVIGCTVLAPFTAYDAISSLDLQLGIFLLTVTIGTAVSYTFISRATRSISTSTMGLALAAAPLITVFSMMIFAPFVEDLDEEHLNFLAICGAFVVVAGLMIGTSRPDVKPGPQRA